MTLVEALDQGGVIYTCGNGGSAAEALHLVEEVIGCYGNRSRQPTLVCLNADPTTLMHCQRVRLRKRFFKATRGARTTRRCFDRVEHQPGKQNIINALQVARDTGTQTIGLLGRP